jgi:hypothetical protein
LDRTSPARRAQGVVCFALLVGMLGCAALPVSLPGMRRSEPGITQDELRVELADFSSRFGRIVIGAGDRIRDATSDPMIRRRALLWQMRLVPLVQQATFAPAPKEAFIAVNGLVVNQRIYLTTGPGAQLFGPQQPIAAEAARQLEDDFYDIARLFLSTEEVAKLRDEVEVYSAQSGLSGSDFSLTNVQRQIRQARESGRFDWVVSVPMSPFRALEGVGSGAEAIHDFNETALRLSQIVESLPQQMRWQTELLLYNAETRESTITALAAMESFAESASQLAGVAERLPFDLEAALGSSQGALAEANRTLLTAQELIEPLRATAEQVALAGASWGTILQSEGEPDPDARPFDIREYEAAAQGIGEAAAELSGLATQIAVLVETQRLESTLSGVDSAVSRVESGGRGVVDHAAWRGLQLLLAFFALLLVYRLVGTVLPRSAGD